MCLEASGSVLQASGTADAQGVCPVSVFSESPCGLFSYSTFSDNFIKSAIIFGLNLMLHQYLVFSFCAFFTHINITKLLGANHNRNFCECK